MLRIRTLALCMLFVSCLFGQNDSFQAEKINLKGSEAILEQEFKAYDLYRLNLPEIDQFVQTSGENVFFNLKLGSDYDWDLNLYPRDIRGENYHVFAQTENGVEIQPARPNMTFWGYLDGPNGGKAGLTINDHHFAGTVSQKGELYFVEPLHSLIKDAPRDILVVYASSDVTPDEGVSCGADELNKKLKEQHDEHGGHGHDHDHDHNHATSEKVVGLCLEVDLAIASDWLMYDKYNSSIPDVEDHNITVMNNVATNWDDEFDDEIVFEIVTQFVSTCNTCDPWTASTNAGTLLGSFRNWGNGGGFGVSYDLAQIWTDRDFNGGTVGVAYLFGVCGNNRYHALQDYTANATRLRVMTSHEIGHNFGSGHDATGSLIMAPFVGTSNEWSTNSQNVINGTILNRFNSGCLTECVDVLPPVADFQGDQLSGCAPLQVQFTDLSINVPTQWSWTFPGGTPGTSNAQNPSVTYNTAGTYSVTMVATNSGGSNTITKNAYITVFDVPTAGFTFLTTDNIVEFTSTSIGGTSYAWDFGDGMTSSEQNPTHFYAEDGMYTVTLIVTNDCGTNVITNLVEVATLPLPNFTSNVVSGCTPLVIAFEDLSTSNTDFWLWDLPGGEPEQSGQQNPVVLYDSPGTYDVTLTVINEVGSTTITLPNYVTVEPLPTPSFTFDQNGTMVDFMNTSTEGTSYSWDFGDGGASMDENPSHTYSMGGTYIVELTVTNDCGSVTTQEFIDIALAPTAGINADVLNGCADLTVMFSDNSSSNVDSWAWTFTGGNPSSSTEQNPVVVYENPGVFDVSLTVTNSIGMDMITEVQYITVNDVPVAGFTSSSSNTTVDFTNTSTNADTYSWDFGDGNNSVAENPSHTYATDGVYTVILTATNDCGEVTTEEMVTIVTVPTAGFSANVTTGCADLTVEFSDESTTNATTWNWTFEGGNPSTSTEENPTVTYNTAGTYMVTLEVSNSAGSNTVTETNYIIVDDVPLAGFTSSTSNATIDFTNTSTNADSYSWDFGDGNNSAAENPTHTYAADGMYTVILTATNDCGEVTTEEMVTIATVPTAGFSANVTTGCADLTVEFSDESTTNATTWNWTFEGGNPSTSTEENPTVTYNTAGTYMVTLEVSNSAGSNTVTETNYIIVDDVPVADFTSSTSNATVDFTNTSTNADTYSWDFGDGNNSAAENPTHTYAADGTYTVILTATNDCGTITTEETITIGTSPQAGFSVDITAGCADLVVQFNDESSANTTAWNWTFEGGSPSSSTDQDPTVTYNTAGTYTVVLEVTNSTGSSTVTETNYIIVDDVPLADFTSSTSNSTIDFTNTSTNADTYSWDFGDGNNSVAENPSHTYAADGTYTVVLTATNDCGSVVTEEMVTIATVPTAGFSANVTSGCADLTVQFSDESTANATSWNWTFEGGSPSTSTEENPTITYNTAGTYMVVLEVSNSAGSNTTTETNFIVVDDVPVAGFTNSVNDAMVDFTNTSTNANTYSWDFGDGNNSVAENPTHTYAADGTYTVTLTATNDCGSITTSQEINIGTLPTASFNADVTEGCADLVVNFTDQSSLNTTEWAWTFEGGNPATSTMQNPQVTFEQTGVYSVTLVATNDSGNNTSTQTDYIVVNTIPNAGFNASTNGTVTDFVNTSSGADTYAWDFGDGGSSNEANPQHDFETDGTYTVVLTASNECGSTTSTESVTIVTLPAAAFDANVTSGCAPLTVQFNDLSSSNTTAWAWTFEGGTPATSMAQNPEVTFNTAGTYTVTLQVTNAAGSGEATETNYIVVNDVPEANFNVSSAGAVIVFTNTSLNSNSVSWDFGDGEMSTEENPMHIYDADGDYEVTLTATNDCGTTMITQTVTAVIAPVAGFSANVTSGCAPLTVEFNNQSTGTTESFSWSFPGGTPSSSSLENPVVTYTTPGTYPVELEVSNVAGSNTAIQTDYIVVNTVPVAGFTGTTANTSVLFTNTSTGATTYSWDFGDGTMSDDTNPSHDFGTDGTYTVTLTAENDCGSVTYMEVIEIVTEPLAGFTADVTSGCADLTVNFTDQSSGNTTSWMWTFEGGNPSTSTEQNPMVNYDTPGNYTVTLVATTGAGSNSYTQNQFIIVNTVPAVDFSTSINGATVNFLNNSIGATTYLWDFGDGMTSSMANPEYTYSADGDYTVTLTAINDCGETTTMQNVSVVSFPSVAFTADVTTGCGPLDVNFTDLSTGNVSAWNWTLPGATPGTSTDQNPSVSYDVPGIYSVTLEATNAAGSDVQTIVSYIVVEDLPQPDFNASITGSTALFTNTSSGSNSVSWDFGDGEGSTEENPLHFYAEDGIYTVTLMVTNSCGTVTTSQEVLIITAPTAMFSADVTSGCAPITVQYTDMSTENTANWMWTFEGGTPATSTDPNPVVTYNSAGTFDVSLLVTNAAGNNTAMQMDYIVIDDVPVADFSSSSTGTTVDFTNLSTNGDTYVWDFGDGGGSSMETNPTYQYSGAGDYNVILTVTNACGSSEIVQAISIIGTAPTAGFTANNTTGCAPFVVDYEDLSTGDPTAWAWTFEGGNPSNSNQQNPAVTYDAPGTYEVSLTVTNDFGDNEIIESSFIVVEDVPMADFTEEDLENGLYNFNNTSTNATTYEWSFGDGEMSTEESPSHQYTESGMYTVLLTATNDCGTETTEIVLDVIITSIEDFENLDVFQLYPNPNNGQFVLVLEGQNVDDLTLRFFNVLGQQLYTELLDYRGGSWTKTYDFDHLAAGTYIVQLRSGDKVLYKKVVIE